jgi:hypothetical protein
MNKLDDITRSLVLAFTHTQVQLEIMDDIKMTKFYKHSMKKNLNALERDLESIIRGEVAEAYVQDEKQFRMLAKHIEYIAQWIADSSFDDILTLGKALHNNEIAFSDDSPEEEPDCKHEDVRLFQSGYKQCQDCKWIWKD